MTSGSTRKIFVNVAVRELKRSTAFFSKLGFAFNPEFTDDTAASMVINPDACVMLLSEPFFKTFTEKETCNTGSHSEALLALGCSSRAEVDDLVNRAIKAGGSPATGSPAPAGSVDDTRNTNNHPKEREDHENRYHYIHFDGNCRQAMSFYQQCIGAQLQLNAYPDAKGQPSSDPDAKIMHGQMSHGGAPILMASDYPPDGSPHRLGNNFSVSIDCESQEELERVFAALGQNGQVRMPLSNVPWGARFGMLTDQFGIQWMFNCNLQQTA